MSIQFELNKWWWKLQDRKKQIAKYPNQYWSAKITAFYQMKCETLAALFFANVKFPPDK